MAELKWVQEPDGRWTGSADGIDHHCGQAIDTEGKLMVQINHDMNIARIAEANGYARLDAGQVVVNRDDLHSILFDANRINEFDFDALVLMRLQKALETKS